MADSHGKDGKAPPRPVYVHHFSKPPRSSAPTPATGVAQPGSPHAAKTVPEMPAFGSSQDEPVTEPRGVPFELPDAAAADRPRRKKQRGGKRREEAARATASRTSKPAAGPLDRSSLAERVLGGHQLFEQGKLDAAREVFEEIVSLGVDDAFPHTMLGTIYLAQGAHDRAVALFEEALALDPLDVAARVYRGEARLSRGRVEPALEDLRRALEVAPPDDPFVVRARRLIRIAGEMEKARR